MSWKFGSNKSVPNVPPEANSLPRDSSREALVGEDTNGAGTASAAASAAAAALLAAEDDRNLTFEEVHKRYHSKIYNLILRLVGNPDDAEDLTMETFENAWRAWGRFRRDSRVSTWLHTIAVNNCKNRFKQNDRRREREGISLDEAIETDSGEVGREIADWSDVPERVLINQELRTKLHEAVSALAPEYRIVLVLCEMEEKSYEEIAQITGLTVAAVKTRLHRARQKVRQRVEPYYRNWDGRRR